MATSIPGPLRAGDVASMLLDLVPDAPCADDGLICTLRQLVDYLVPAILLMALCVALGFMLAIWLSLFAARRERASAARARPTKKLLSGPVHTDGTWVRLVEDGEGRRVVEVLDGGTWKPSSRGLSQFAADVPLGIRPPG